MKREIRGLLFWPEHNFVQGESLDSSVIKAQCSDKTATSILREAKDKRIELSITGHLRGVDGCGSSLDLPEFQRTLTKIGVRKLMEFPSTPTIASRFTVKVRFEPASRDDIIEYIALDYGITENNPYVGEGLTKLTPDGRTPNGQKDAPAFIFRNIFGLKGVRIICESISPMALAGGMESSNVFNVALIAAGSMLSGADLSYADIFSLAVKLENDEFGGLTGGQGHLCCIVGGAYRHVWLSGIKDATGNLTHPYGAFSIPLLGEDDFPAIEENMMLVQAGKEYANGKAKVGRTAALINNMWTDLLRDKDSVGILLYQKMLGLTARYTKAITKKDFAKVVYSIIDYVRMRDDLCVRWISLALDAHNGKDVPKHAHEYSKKVFDKDHTEFNDYDVVRQAHEEHGEGLRSISLYTMEPIAGIVAKAREEEIAIMPLGAGGPGANLIAVSGRGRAHLKEFFDRQGLNELTEGGARTIIRGSGVLKGYMPLKVGKDPLRINGFKELGAKIPDLPNETPYNRYNMKFSAPKKGGKR